MKNRILPFLILILLGLSSCEKEHFALNDEVSIGYKSEICVDFASGKELKIKYTDLVNESRCPPLVECVWEGFVIVEIELDDNQKVELGLGPGTTSTITQNGYTIELLSVNYDSGSDFGDQAKSSIVIKVE